jgi:hypothetical protein
MLQRHLPEARAKRYDNKERHMQECHCTCNSHNSSISQGVLHQGSKGAKTLDRQSLKVQVAVLGGLCTGRSQLLPSSSSSSINQSQQQQQH